MNVLFVEDNPDDAELTRRALQECKGCREIVHADSGLEAIRFIFCEGEHFGRDPARSPRMVLLDLNMPGLDGLEVLRRIKADIRTRAIPVVMLSSSREARDVRQSYELGANSYVVKPVEVDDYMRKVSALGRYWTTISESSGD